MNLNLVFLLEEPSARELIKQVMPRIFPGFCGLSPFYLVFQGKQDLENNIERKIRSWRSPNSVFIVLRDQDSGDCKVIKQNLDEKVNRSGKKSVTLVRIACRELESWYLGDMPAVEEALAIEGFAHRFGSKSQFRDPDSVISPAAELSKITERKYQKIEGSREIGMRMVIERNRSRSFKFFVEGVKKLVDQQFTTL